MLGRRRSPIRVGCERGKVGFCQSWCPARLEVAVIGCIDRSRGGFCVAPCVRDARSRAVTSEVRFGAVDASIGAETGQ